MEYMGGNGRESGIWGKAGRPAARPQECALGAAPGSANPPGRPPGPGRTPKDTLRRPKDTLFIWPDFSKSIPSIGAWGPRKPFILSLVGPGPGRSPQSRARPAQPGPAPALPGPSQNTKVAQDAKK